MRSFLIKFFIGLAFVFAQLLLCKFIAYNYFTPNLMIVFYGFLAYFPLGLSNLYAIFTVGIIADLTNGLNILGPSAAAGVIVYLSLSFVVRALLSDHFIALCLALMFGTAIFNFLYFLILGSEGLNLFNFLPKLTLNALVNGVLGGLALYFGKHLVGKQSY
ncbi:MAG TPA: hypothetical protein PKD37_01875 [Oligoflexia bacterium]|nr:hypothetical protein [Oligoflexia bacterium]HMP26726.1 hypothetical protein [Oligoflexia bacterium]